MISVNLQHLRKLNSFSQEEVAEKIGVSRQAVAKWENGETVPDLRRKYMSAIRWQEENAPAGTGRAITLITVYTG